jgi:tyrosyl-tRNA synthetase
MKLYDELIWRGMIKDVSNEEKAQQLLNNETIQFYCGFDPTGESLTVGHLVQVVRMMLLAKHQHTPIVLIGGATGLIGDPKETSERKLLTLEESLKNAELIKKQLSQFIDPKQAIFVNNYDWIGKIDMITFLRDYGKSFTINYMLAKDTVQRRLDIGISYTEFSYMLIQAIDFHHLYKNFDCKLQFGGSDQWGNITTGLELIRKMEGDQAFAVGLSSPLLLKADGSKFGKSESGALWLDPEMTSPYELYQYFINASDLDLENYLKTLTLLSVEEIQELLNKSQTQPELREAQKKLAMEIVTLVHGNKALVEAMQVTDALFTGDFMTLSNAGFNMLERVLNKARYEENKTIIDLLVESQLASSKREARDFIRSNAIFLNQRKITSLEDKILDDDLLYDAYAVLRRGKKRYAIIKKG